MKSFSHFYGVIKLMEIKRIDGEQVVWNGLAPSCMNEKMVKFLAQRKISKLIKEFTDDWQKRLDKPFGDTIQWRGI